MLRKELLVTIVNSDVWKGRGGFEEMKLGAVVRWECYGRVRCRRLNWGGMDAKPSLGGCMEKGRDREGLWGRSAAAGRAGVGIASLSTKLFLIS